MSSFQLYIADAIDLMRSLPDESVDLIVTDTAYESLEKHRAVGTTTRLKQSAASSNEWFPIFGNERFAEFFAESFRVLKKNAHLYFYCDNETAFIAKPEGEKAGFKFWKPLVWAKTKQGMTPDADELVVEHQAMGMGYHGRASYEFILFFEKGKRRLSDLSVRDVLPFPVVRNGYPTQKPVELNRVLIRISSAPGETVLDPFMGSGSTGVAAIRNGRHFIGGDIQANAVADVGKLLKLENAESRGEPIVVAATGERPARPEPAPKKTRSKKAPKNVVSLGTAPEPEPPSAPEAECLSCGDSGVDLMADGSTRTCHCRVVPRDRVDGMVRPLASPPPADPDCSLDLLEGGSGTKPIRAPHGILETLDALGVPHHESPRQMFEIKVSDEPLPPAPEVSSIKMIEDAFAAAEAALSAPLPVTPACPNATCSNTTCHALNRCLAIQPISDADLI